MNVEYILQPYFSLGHTWISYENSEISTLFNGNLAKFVVNKYFNWVFLLQKNAAKRNMSGAVCALSMYKLSHCTRFNVIRVLLCQFYCDFSNPTVCKFIVNRLILLYQDYFDLSYPTVLVSL